MSDLQPLIRFFRALDESAEHVRKTAWGVIATDARFPQIWDANYASVDDADTDVSLWEVEEGLIPAAEEAGIGFAHVVLLAPDHTARLVRDIERRGDRILFDTVMEQVGSISSPAAEHEVREIEDPSAWFWDRVAEAFREFDVTTPEVIGQMVERERRVLTPFGKRWFAANVEGEPAGIAALFVLDGVGYVDNVVTFSGLRRRGIASSMVSAVVAEARAGGAEPVYLLADQPGPIRLYERLGFRAVGRVASSVRPLTPG